MSEIELGIALQGDKSSDAYAHLARVVEDGGFDLISVYADLFFQPAIYPLLTIAQHTARIRLGPACLNPFLLHPVEIAGHIAALDAASHGRAFLGLARGAWLDQLGMKPRHPLAALKDALEVVACLLGGDRSGYSGSVFSLASGAGLNFPVIRPRVPIMVGTWGRKGTAVAAELADEVKIGGSANPHMVTRARAWLQQDAATLGRAQDAVGVVIGAVTVVDEDGAAARRHAKTEIAPYLEVIGALDPTYELPPELLSSLRRLVRERNVEAAGRLIPDDVLDRFAFAGTPAQVVRQVESIVTAGAVRVEFGTPHGLDEEHGIRLLATKVLPAVR